ncbi:MAG: hypothetical protein LBJ20_03345 [Candidatus Methanoplasma sp.]|jgi:KEOPS complex subunit Pcc1|nr:hypothetical protein [Candidatus Methanoplasma sp.]
MFTAEIKITSDGASGIISALGPEAGRELPRTKACVGCADGIGTIRLAAADASAMRASLNTYLECIRITEEIDTIIR